MATPYPYVIEPQLLTSFIVLIVIVMVFMLLRELTGRR
jgi:hypothetical protein